MKLPRNLHGVFYLAMNRCKLPVFVATGEYRQAKRGEYFLAGTVVEVSIARQDSCGPEWIAREVKLVECPHCKGTGRVVEDAAVQTQQSV